LQHGNASFAYFFAARFFDRAARPKELRDGGVGSREMARLRLIAKRIKSVTRIVFESC
jgi:hypothetical protein